MRGLCRATRGWAVHGQADNGSFTITLTMSTSWAPRRARAQAHTPNSAALVGAALKGTRGAIYCTPPGKARNNERRALCVGAELSPRDTFSSARVSKALNKMQLPLARAARNFIPQDELLTFEMEWKQPLSSIATAASFHAALQFFF